MGFTDVFSPNARRQTVWCVVGFGCDLVDTLEGHRRYDRSEDFLLHDLHTWSGIDQHRWLDEVAAIADGLAAHHRFRAFVQASLHVAAHAPELLFGNQRSHIGIGIHAW